MTRAAREEQEAEEARLDERWDRLSAGELSAEEEAELRALAAGSEEGRQAFEAFRPLGPGFQARMVQEIQALQAGAQEAASAAAEVPDTSAPAPAGRETRGRVLPFWRRRPAQLGGWTAAAAAAAAAVILLVNGLGRPPALPMYGALEMAGGIAGWRGEEGPDPLVLAPGSPLKLTLRPDTAVQGKLAARCFLERDGELQLWDVPEPVFLKGGLVKIEGTVGRDIQIAPGEWTVWIVVGRPRKLPAAEDLRPHLDQGSAVQARDWIAQSARLRVRRESG